ncbi:hypothetical protein [Amycolatopsis sp. GM8]|uniref:hypothetical protein n=1 Tax=Amycolatopsis sp. GM8 TaxID=2896530 RepID=UPI001F1B49F9|nr:hypothetical protein [Amycolatopsis sp. GM8]
MSKVKAILLWLPQRILLVVFRLVLFVRNSPKWTLGILGAVTVILAGAAGTAFVVHQRVGDTEAARTEASDAAKKNVATLLSYDYRSIDGAANQRADLLTDAFKNDYAQLVTNTVAPAAKSRKLVTTTTVAAESVVDASRDQVALLLFLNQQSQADGTDQPIYTGSRVRVVVKNVDGGWRVSQMTPL